MKQSNESLASVHITITQVDAAGEKQTTHFEVDPGSFSVEIARVVKRVFGTEHKNWGMPIAMRPDPKAQITIRGMVKEVK